MYSGWSKSADLISTTGAGVLGAGVGVLFAGALVPYTLHLLLIGLVCHGWGMYEKHRSDTQQGEHPPRWAELVYWFCWILLSGLVVFILSRSM